MNAKSWVVIGACYGFIAVALGAFGAHALKEVLDEKSAAVYQTAVHYQMFHALALIALGIWAQQFPVGASLWVGGCFSLGVLLFSGSLYILALSGIRALGMITPIGGVLFLVGWILFAFLAARA